MQNRLLHIALFAAAIAGTGSMVAMLSHGHVPFVQPSPLSPAASATVADKITLLPVVTVTTAASIPTLPTITVRPERTSMTGLKNHHVFDLAVRDTRSGDTVLLSNAAFNMSYHSSEQAMRRTGKSQ
jgi:hypothetical protein